MLDQKITDLNAVQTWSENDLVIIGRATDGRLFKSTLGDLKAYLTGSAGINRLSTPAFLITSVTITVINFKVIGDARSEKFVVRLATDSSFNTVIRNTTITLPQSTGQFTGLDPSGTYFLDVIAQANGFTDSLVTTISVATSPFVPSWVTGTSLAKLPVPTFASNELIDLSTNIIEGAKRLSTDGQNVPIILPDGNQYYPWTYTRDFSMAIAARRDLFTASYITNWLNWVGAKVNTSNWQVPDHIAVNGDAFFQAQNGSRSVLDNQTWFINLVWEAFKKSSNTTWFTSNRVMLDHILTDGLPLTNGVVTIPLWNYGDAAYQQWGFNDSEVSTGVCTTINVFYFHALNQMAEMASSAGDLVGAASYLARAAIVKNHINTNLFDSTYGLYRTSTGKNSGQYDIWASMYAVSWGLATTAIASQISTKLVATKDKWLVRGNVRMVATDNEFNPGVRVWEAFLDNRGGIMTTDPLQTVGNVNAYNNYQHGGYWTTICEHAQITIAITDPVLAKEMFLEAHQSMLQTNGVEWLNENGNMNVEKYTASMAPLAYVQSTPLTNSTYGNAFGLSRLIESYSGPVVELYNPTTKATQKIGLLNNGNYDLSAHNTAISNGFTKVRKLFDQSGNLLHATQYNPALMTTAVLGSINGNPAIQFEQNKYLFYTTPVTGSAARFLSVAARNTAPGNTPVTQIAGQVTDNVAGHWFAIQFRNYQGATGFPYLSGYGQDLTDGTAPNSVTAIVATVSYDGTTAFLRRNGTQIATGAKSITTRSTSFIGNPITSDVSAFLLAGIVTGLANNITTIQGVETKLLNIVGSGTSAKPDAAFPQKTLFKNV